jgi:hypothetical protein
VRDGPAVVADEDPVQVVELVLEDPRQLTIEQLGDMAPGLVKVRDADASGPPDMEGLTMDGEATLTRDRLLTAFADHVRVEAKPVD